jgi:hypothetical protein
MEKKETLQVRVSMGWSPAVHSERKNDKPKKRENGRRKKKDKRRRQIQVDKTRCMNKQIPFPRKSKTPKQVDVVVVGRQLVIETQSLGNADNWIWIKQWQEEDRKCKTKSPDQNKTRVKISKSKSTTNQNPTAACPKSGERLGRVKEWKNGQKDRTEIKVKLKKNILSTRRQWPTTHSKHTLSVGRSVSLIPFTPDANPMHVYPQQFCGRFL